MKAVQVKNVWEKYRIKFIIDKKVRWEDFWALKDIGFDVEKGESVCIIGENGAGKTTLLKLIAGMMEPDRGTIAIDGEVSALLDLGAGFHPELTGRENLYLNASLFGLSKEEIEARFEEIVEFSGIGKFIDAPAKTYSQGMWVRLGFAIAIHVNPDVLLIDDTLAVGDTGFQEKCIKKIFELKDRGKTILFVSHDMNLATQLCQRAIFLREGVIVEDGPVRKVISHYMQAVGDKCGIVTLQKGPLRAIFNNGKLLLNWDGKELTKRFGGYTSLFSKDRWHLSTSAKWQVQSLSEDRAILKGRWTDLPIAQIWKVNPTNDGVNLEIDMEVEEEVEIKQRQTGFMLRDEYDRWISLFNQGNFPEKFAYGRDWEDINELNTPGDLIGVKSSGKDVDPMPAVILDSPIEGSRNILRIQNTAYEIGARVLQSQIVESENSSKYLPGKYKYFSGRIRIIENDKLLDGYLSELRQRLVLERTVQQGNLRLFVDGGRVRLYWDEKELTAGIGLNTNFTYLGKEYSSDQARWEITKKGETKMVGILRWKEAPITQIWETELRENNILDWKVQMEVYEKAKVLTRQAGINLLQMYDRWVTSSEQGEFPRDGYNRDLIEVNLMDNKSRIIGVKGWKGMDSLPGVIFDFSGDESIRVGSVKKKSYGEIDATILYSLEVDSKESLHFQPGEYPYFKGKILIRSCEDQERFLSEQRSNESERKRKIWTSNRLKKGPLEVLFDDGKGKIFWDGVELTQSLGMYTSVRSSSIWYDSAKAVWNVQKTGGDKIVATGFWPRIPISQIWEVELLGNGALAWKVEMDIYDDVCLEREQTNVMVQDRYRNWVVKEQAYGRFPREFRDNYGVFWDRMWCGSTKDGLLEVKAFDRDVKDFPSIILDCSSQGPNHQAIIENSSSLFRGRVLQCQKINSARGINFSPSRYEYFSGKVKVMTGK